MIVINNINTHQYLATARKWGIRKHLNNLGKESFDLHLNHNDALFPWRKSDPRCNDNRQRYRSPNHANPHSYAKREKQVAEIADLNWGHHFPPMPEKSQSGFRANSRSVGCLELNRSQLAEEQTAFDVSGTFGMFLPRLNQWITVERISRPKTPVLFWLYLLLVGLWLSEHIRDRSGVIVDVYQCYKHLCSCSRNQPLATAMKIGPEKDRRAPHCGHHCEGCYGFAVVRTSFTLCVCVCVLERERLPIQ